MDVSVYVIFCCVVVDLTIPVVIDWLCVICEVFAGTVCTAAIAVDPEVSGFLTLVSAAGTAVDDTVDISVSDSVPVSGAFTLVSAVGTVVDDTVDISVFDSVTVSVCVIVVTVVSCGSFVSIFCCLDHTPTLKPTVRSRQAAAATVRNTALCRERWIGTDS
ncbi:MAG: hypothetical protein K5695_07780 [Oscillospiraceae bacterium]|nr:hypothetical protein [Oscillospiraceae bacterium]